MAAGCSASARLMAACALSLLFVGPRALGAQGVLRGVVADSSGDPIAAADVAIVSLHQLARTDDRGRFVLANLPLGDVDVSVRRLGFAPRTLRVKVASANDSTRITLASLPEVLDALTASSRRARMEIEQFYRRRARGPGVFFTRDEIEDRHPTSMSNLLRTAPGIQVVRGAAGNGVRFIAGSGRRGCSPLVWIDGQKAPGMEVDQIPLSDVEGIELYQGASTTPTQFMQNMTTTCGTIVVWTRLPG
jgi:carboxypeptidase family protein/TonB-dependent receptor-like protein